MHRPTLWLVLIVFTMTMATGCAMARAPVNGIWYSDVKGPVGATSNSGGDVKSGSATAQSILGLIATGDASIEAAMADGGITKIRNVDHHSKSFLGIVASFTTTVYGW